MPYVSCMYAPPDETGMLGAETKEGENARIVCTDDNDPPQLWWLSEDFAGRRLAALQRAGRNSRAL